MRGAVFVTFLFLLSLVAATSKEELLKTAIGPCINDDCPTGYSCFYGQCIPVNGAPQMPNMDPSTAIGPCINGMCPNSHFCQKEQCYPN